MAATIRFDLDISKMTVQGGDCITVVDIVQNEIQIHQQKQKSRNFAICFLSQLFYSQFDIVKI